MNDIIRANMIDDVLFAITIGEQEPVEKYIQGLREQYSEIRKMPCQDLIPLLPLLSALQENSPTYFRQLLQITGLRLLILSVKNSYPVFEKLVALNFDQDYVVYIYSELMRYEEVDAHLIHYPMQVFGFPAELAKSLHKNKALEAIYEAGFYLNIPFLPDDKVHPLAYAAKNDLILGRAYITASRRTKLLNYDRQDGYSVLIDILEADNYELMKLCLENEACADIMLPTGESLLDAAATHGKDMQLLILSHGGRPATRALSALYKTVNDMTSTVVNAESFEAVLDDYSRKYCHEYVNGYTLYSVRQRADVFQTAVRLQNKAVLKRLLQHLRIHVTDEQIESFFSWSENNPEQIENCTPESVVIK